MCLQIFPPSCTLIGHDGLYRIRYGMIASWIILPNICASLAFIYHGGGYEATGAWCVLPLRPYWYRLALSWVPRYLIWLFIMGVAIRIYRHVGKEFRVFGHERDRSSSLSMPGESAIQRVAAETLRRTSLAAGSGDVEKQAADEEIAPDDTSVRAIKSPGISRHSPLESTKSLPYADLRRPSAPEWSSAFGFRVESPVGVRSIKSTPGSRRGSRQMPGAAAGIAAEDFAAPSGYDPSRHRGSATTLGSVRSNTSRALDVAPVLAPIREDKRNSASTGSGEDAHNAAAEVIQSRRRAIQRQLRLLFIYPVVYMVLWTIPCVYQAMNYSNYYAQNPIFVLSALNTFCQCALGFADVSVFCYREKPWKHIPGSDGTFWGSFCFWRVCFGLDWIAAATARRQSRAPSDLPAVGEGETEKERSESQSGLLASLKRWSLSMKGSSPRPSEASVTAPAPIARTRSSTHRRVHSGGSDRHHLEIERAHDRLAMERAEWEKNRKSWQEHRTSIIGMQNAPGQTPVAERKEWWDRHVSDDLFRDQDDHGGAL